MGRYDCGCCDISEHEAAGDEMITPACSLCGGGPGNYHTECKCRSCAVLRGQFSEIANKKGRTGY